MRQDTAAGSLNKRCHALLQLDFHPFHVFKMKDEHVVCESTTLSLPSVDKHRLFIDGRTVVLASTSREASCFALNHSTLICIELKQLISALAHLSFFIEHEAAAERVDFAIESH